MSTPATLSWLARHEISLSWRDFIMMMTAGKIGRQSTVLMIIMVAVIALHGIAWLLLAGSASSDAVSRLILVTGMIGLSFSLMSSQAMESITRIFYSRSDLDLILSSPVSQKRIFVVRIGSVALSTTALSVLLAAPAINIMVLTDSPTWLAAVSTNRSST